MQKLDPPGAMCSNPGGVALEATLDHYSLIRDRQSRWPSSSPIFERILCCWLVRGALDIPNSMSNYLLDSQPLRHPFPVRTVVHSSYKQQARPLCLSPDLLVSPGFAAVASPVSSPASCGAILPRSPSPVYRAITTITTNTAFCLCLHEVNAVFSGALWEGR